MKKSHFFLTCRLQALHPWIKLPRNNSKKMCFMLVLEFYAERTFGFIWFYVHKNESNLCSFVTALLLVVPESEQRVFLFEYSGVEWSLLLYLAFQTSIFGRFWSKSLHVDRSLNPQVLRQTTPMQRYLRMHAFSTFFYTFCAHLKVRKPTKFQRKFEKVTIRLKPPTMK